MAFLQIRRLIDKVGCTLHSANYAPLPSVLTLYPLHILKTQKTEDKYAAHLRRKGIAKTDATDWLKPVRDKHLIVSIRDGMMGRDYDATMTTAGVRLDTNDWIVRYKVALHKKSADMT